jgi:chaperonin GroES
MNMALKMKPLADRVVVRPLEAEEKTASGLYIPDTAKEKPMQGEIVAVGPGKVADDGKKIAMELKVGDRVLYGKYSGTEVRVDGDDLLIMRESDIFAILA